MYPSIQNPISSIHFQHTNTFTSNNIHVSEVHCGSDFESGGSVLPNYCTPPMFVPDVLGALTVCWFSKKKSVQWWAFRKPKARPRAYKLTSVVFVTFTEVWNLSPLAHRCCGDCDTPWCLHTATEEQKSRIILRAVWMNWWEKINWCVAVYRWCVWRFEQMYTQFLHTVHCIVKFSPGDVFPLYSKFVFFCVWSQWDNVASQHPASANERPGNSICELSGHLAQRMDAWHKHMDLVVLNCHQRPMCKLNPSEHEI